MTAGGRPTKLNDEAIAKAEEYINGGFVSEGDMIPSMVGMADTLGVVTNTLYNWGEADERFLRILEKCNQRQQRVLVNGGLSGEMNATICKLVLGKHGYHDRQEHTGPDGGAVKTQTSVVFVGVESNGSKDT